MIKSYLKRIFSIISLLFCTMSIASAWSVWIEGNDIKFETTCSGYDLRNARNIIIPVRIAEISNNIIREILDSDHHTITFYKYFRINNVNYELNWDINGDCENKLSTFGATVNLQLNYDDIINNRQNSVFNWVIIN